MNEKNEGGFKLMQSYDSLIELLDFILGKKPDHGVSWYGKARIEALRFEPGKAIKALEKAITLDEKFKKAAKFDKAFDPMRKLKEFKKLIK